MKKSQDKKKAGLTREEFIKVEPNVYLHVIAEGKGRPVTLKGFGQSSQPYGLYD